jgi:murein DD-endopeptidase MepM/ murein hydrolase activator NlpD
MATRRPIDGVEPLRGTRTGAIGRRGVFALAVCVLLVATVVLASLPLAQHGTAANNATPIAAASASPSPTDAASDSPSPSPQLSPSAPATAEPRIGTPIPGSAFLAYTVRAGDTLSRIANAFGLSMSTLYWANSISVPDPQLVKIGQVMKIPPMDGLVISVTAGATVKSIADKYGIDSQQLIDANNLTDTTLVVGELLLVPGADTPPLPVKQAPAPAPPNWFGKLLWPAYDHYKITQRFGCTGWPGEPRYGKCRHYHDGLDIGGPKGVPILAAASGTVIYAGWRKAGTDGAAGGIVVWISHGGGTLYTTYNHLSAVSVKIGQHVTMGQRIGSMGETGAAQGTHLHFEVWVCYPWTGGTISCDRNPLLYVTPSRHLAPPKPKPTPTPTPSPTF